MDCKRAREGGTSKSWLNDWKTRGTKDASCILKGGDSSIEANLSKKHKRRGGGRREDIGG